VHPAIIMAAPVPADVDALLLAPIRAAGAPPAGKPDAGSGGYRKRFAEFG
jgi:hypothetical protein